VKRDEVKYMVVKNSRQQVKATELKKYLLEKNISNHYVQYFEPFDIIFDNFIFKAEQALRILPNRRLVLSGTIHDTKKVILKIFIDPVKYQKDYIKNEQGYNWLQRLELDTPKIISAYCDHIQQQSYFISQYIEHDLSNINHQILIAAIAQLHKNNICQNDLHINNFILNKNKVYYLDYAALVKVNSFNGNIKSCAQFNNFALFLAQLDMAECIKWPIYIQCYLNYYFQDQIIAYSHVDIEKYILHKAKKLLESRLNDFTNKCRRDCTDFKLITNNDLTGNIHTSISGLIKRSAIIDYDLAYVINQLLQTELEDKNNILNSHLIATLKNGNTARVLLLEHHNKKFIIKHYLPGKKWQQLIRTVKYLFIKPRAMKSWLNANFLEHLGVATAKPIAFLLQRKGVFTKDSFFIMEYIENIQRLDTILENKELNTVTKHKYLSQIKCLLDNFAFLRIVHRDFKSVNLGIKEEQLFLLDLDALHQYNSKFFYEKVKDKDNLRIIKCLKSYPDLLEFYKSTKITKSEKYV
jgi:tRNA A-37 threonylcarbamoyl transferase component Bud32